MRQLTVFFLIALVSFTIAADKFSSPADKVLEKVDELVQASRTEQAEQTKIYTRNNKRCKTEFTFRNKEISDASVSKGASSTQLAICKAEVPVATASKKASSSEEKASVAQIQSLIGQNELYIAANQQRAVEHEQILSAITEAYTIIAKFANGNEALKGASVFFQVTQKLNTVMRISIKHNMHVNMYQVLAMLAQTSKAPATTVSTSSLSKVVDLLRQLEARVKKSEESRIKQFSSYTTLFNKQRGILASQINTLKSIVKRYKKYISNLNSCVGRETRINKLANEKFDRNTGILDASKKMCSAYTVKYTKQTKERTEYLALLAKLRAFIVTTISDFKSGVYSVGDFRNTL